MSALRPGTFVTPDMIREHARRRALIRKDTRATLHIVGERPIGVCLPCWRARHKPGAHRRHACTGRVRYANVEISECDCG